MLLRGTRREWKIWGSILSVLVFSVFQSYAVGWYPVVVYRIDPHATLWHHMMMKIWGSILSFFLFNHFILRRRLQSCCSLQDRPSCHVVAPDENENFEGLSCQFFYLFCFSILRRRLLSCRSLQDRPSCHIVAPYEDGNIKLLRSWGVEALSWKKAENVKKWRWKWFIKVFSFPHFHSS